MRLGEHAAARIVTAGDLEDDPSNRQTIFNGLRVRMAVNTGALWLLQLVMWQASMQFEPHCLVPMSAFIQAGTG